MTGQRWQIATAAACAQRSIEAQEDERLVGVLAGDLGAGGDDGVRPIVQSG